MTACLVPRPTRGLEVKIRLAATALFAIALPTATGAQAADPIRAGKWEYTVTTQMPNMPQLPPGVKLPPNVQVGAGAGGGMTVTHTSCVTASDPTAELRRPHGPSGRPEPLRDREIGAQRRRGVMGDDLHDARCRRPFRRRRTLYRRPHGGRVQDPHDPGERLAAGGIEPRPRPLSRTLRRQVAGQPVSGEIAARFVRLGGGAMAESENGRRPAIRDGGAAPDRQPGGVVRALIGAAIVVAGLYFASPVLEPLALAVLLSLMLAPAARWLQRHRFGRVAAVSMTVLLALRSSSGSAPQSPTKRSASCRTCRNTRPTSPPRSTR